MGADKQVIKSKSTSYRSVLSGYLTFAIQCMI